jgi:[ribosomal protein S5]-alanine N-acetyltransferase
LLYNLSPPCPSVPSLVTLREMKTILQTPRLLVRELSEDDLDEVSAMLTDPEVMRFWPRPFSREESAEWIGRQRKRYEEYGFGYWMAVEKATGQAVGQVGVLPRVLDGVDEVDIGYIIRRSRWREGFASEGAAGCRDHVFEKLARSRVLCLVRPENAPSLGVARKIGFKTDGRIILHAGFDHIVFTGTPEPELTG